jgi:Tfp pilus assembly protein PilN
LRRALTLWASAAALVVAAAGVHGYGLKRELSAVQGAREFIAPQVSRALEIRRTAYAVQDRLEALDGIERDTPRWTPALAALTEVLPSSTYLVSLSTDGLSVRLGGVTRATEIIAPELEDSPFFRDVRLMNVRASSSPGEEGTEFDLSLALQAAVSPTPEGGGGQ